MSRRISPLVLRRALAASPAPESPNPLLHPPGPLPVSQWAQSALGFSPDPLQSAILDAPSRRLLLLCTRQFGKSTLAAIKALHFALAHPRSTVLCVSPTLRRSAEWLRLLKDFFAILAAPPSGATPPPRLSCPLPSPLPPQNAPAALNPAATPAPRATASAHALILPNRSRVLALPGAASTNRGYSAHLLIYEEAAFVPDPVFAALAPSVAVTGGALWLISSAGEPSGFFYELWTNAAPEWTRFQATAAQCPRISRQFLDEARRALGEKEFQREYFCQFAPDSLQLLDAGALQSVLDQELDSWLLESIS